MPNSLGLCDDVDDVELIEDIEASFGVTFSGEETVTWFTVGDIFESLRRRFPDTAVAGEKCATSMAFYRLRRAIPERQDTSRLRPHTPLESLTQLSAKEWLRLLGNRSGLRLPRYVLSWRGMIGVYMIVASVITAFGLLLGAARMGEAWLGLAPFVLAGIGVMLIRVDGGVFPKGCKTLGELARRVVTMNFGYFLAEGADPREGGLWTALVDLLAQHTQLPKLEIASDTWLLHRQSKGKVDQRAL